MMLKSNNRTLLVLLMVLLVTNGIMLYYLTREQPKELKEPELSRSERTIKMVQEELGLTPSQVNEYLQLRTYRDSLMKPLQSEIRAAKLDMLLLLRKDEVNNDSLKTLANKVSNYQAMMEIEYFNHFKRMQKMLSAEQQPKFDSLLQRMVYRSTGGTDSLPKPAGN